MKRLAVTALTLVALGSFPRSYAQSALTSLQGVVRDSSGAVIPDAHVRISNAAIGFTSGRATSASGEYSFQQIRPGTYKVEISASGFAASTESVELLVNEPATLNVRLTVGDANATVNVSATNTNLNTTDASLGTPFSSTQIQLMPFEGNSVLDLLSLQAGVVSYGGVENITNETYDSRYGSVNGGRSDQGNITTDGIDNNDQTQGLAFTGALRSTRDSLEEFRVTTSNSNADSGRSSGAQVSLITRSGTNNWHGSAYWYARPTNTVANNWFNKNAEIGSGQPNIPARKQRNTYGASLGGPIFKNKLFFFATYEGQKTNEDAQVVNWVPLDSFKAGNINYVNASGGVTTLDLAQIASMDTKCTSNGTCPQGPGVDPAFLKYLANYPKANDFNTGDGYNTAGYTFPSPQPTSLITYIFKLDYHPNETHQIFVRGNLQTDNAVSGAPFPNTPPSGVTYSDNKGIAGGDIWTINDHMVNNLRYGFIRQGSAFRGAQTQGMIVFLYGNLSPQTAAGGSTTANVPVHNLVDDFTWNKGRHIFQFGGNYRAIFNNSATSAPFPQGVIDYQDMPQGIANAGGSLDPGAHGFPAVNSGFAPTYDQDISDLAGIISGFGMTYNYGVNAKNNSFTLLPNGTWPTRSYFNNEFEYYAQDSWRITPRLTLTFGLRHSLLQVPYERNGQQEAPNTSISRWFQNRMAGATQGKSIQPEISLSPSGQGSGRPGYWKMDKANIAPRFSIAWTPEDKTSIRAGFGMFYDHFGAGVVNAFTTQGSLGLSQTVNSPRNLTVDTAPRFTGPFDVPTSNLPPPPTAGSFPVAWDSQTQGESWYAQTMLDNLHTPYSYDLDLSFQHDLGKGYAMELAYTGRLGRRLLQQIDVAPILDLTDPKSGMDYYAAATYLSKAVDAGLTPNQVKPLQYWEDMFPGMATKDIYGSATANIYADIWRYNRGNETSAIYTLDQGYADSSDPTFRYFDPQYVGLFGWSSIGTSSYHSLQASLHHAYKNGVQFDLNYTWSHSIDLGSDAERIAGANVNTMRGLIINSFNLKQNKGSSDFDIRHNFTANGIYDLPFGRGRRFGANMPRIFDIFLGGWSLTGLAHLSSGMPWSPLVGLGYGTNWDWNSWGVVTGPIQSGGRWDDAGHPSAIKNRQQALAHIRAPYPGEAGTRNPFRGQRYFSMNNGLNKTFAVWREQQLKFSWEVVNVTNAVNFDPASITNDPWGSALNFSHYNSALPPSDQARVMQFALRYSF